MLEGGSFDHTSGICFIISQTNTGVVAETRIHSSEGEGSLAASANSSHGAGCRWGSRSGTENDRDDLNEIISAELIKTENHGDCFGCLNESNL